MSAVKVRVTLQIEVDAEEWDLMYGTGTSTGTVRSDVRSYVLNHVQQSAGLETATVRLA